MERPRQDGREPLANRQDLFWAECEQLWGNETPLDARSLVIREVSPSGAFENALKPLQYCKVISLQLIKINGKIKKLKKLKMNKLKKKCSYNMHATKPVWLSQLLIGVCCSLVKAFSPILLQFLSIPCRILDLSLFWCFSQYPSFNFFSPLWI